MRASDAQQLCPGQDHQLVDLWNDAQPGLGLNNTAELCELQEHSNLPYPVTANGQHNSACIYEDDVFLNRVISSECVSFVLVLQHFDLFWKVALKNIMLVSY